MAYARNLAIALLPLTLMACAGAAVSPAARDAATVPPTPSAEEDARSQSPYGLFLAGQAAFDGGHSDAAARYFSRAAVRTPARRCSRPSLHRRPARRGRRQGRRPGAARPQTDAMIERLGALTQGWRNWPRATPGRPEDLHQRRGGRAPQIPRRLLAPSPPPPRRCGGLHRASGDTQRARFPTFSPVSTRSALRARRPVRRAEPTIAVDRDRRCRRRASVALGELLERRGRQNDALATTTALAKSPTTAASDRTRQSACPRQGRRVTPTLRQEAAER